MLLDAAFDPTSKVVNLARSAEEHNRKATELGRTNAVRLIARNGRTLLLDLAYDLTAYPNRQ